MKNIILLLLMTTAFLFSSNLSTLYKLYEKQEYDKACDYAVKHFYKKRNQNSENYLTLYGLSCLETDKIYRIATPMLRLKETKDARANSAYFSTILLQKNLLRQALVDKVSLTSLNLPNTNFILSKIFKLYTNKEYVIKDDIYTFKDVEKKEMKYQLYIEENKKKEKFMIIDSYKDGKFIHRYRYK
ncbi:MAG: Unknown protein [uncultured Sulfurovum sp.]|uniref:Uncharacterized protein n=1 Tax=uncultured Sulfurovum sp. TaxID=269237 RepID=A0A6S6TLN9_9BACT|nr:MAG: Unknown protein [uncultured Sulfurovum sp.]